MEMGKRDYREPYLPKNQEISDAIQSLTNTCAHCPKNNLNLRIRTQTVTNGADATPEIDQQRIHSTVKGSVPMGVDSHHCWDSVGRGVASPI